MSFHIPKPSSLGLLLISAVLFLFTVITVMPTQAAETGASTGALEVPKELTKEQIDDLVARLSDQEVRELLLEQLNKIAIEPEDKELEKQEMIDRFVWGMKRAEHNIETTVTSLGAVHTLPGVVWSKLTEGSDASAWGIVLKILIFFAVGFIVEHMFRRSRLSMRKSSAPDKKLPFRSKVKLSLLRAVVEAVAIIIFILATVVTWLIVELPTENANFLFTALLSAITIWRLIALALRLVLAPKAPWRRLADVDDSVAQSAYSKLLILTALFVFGMWAIDEIFIEFGISGAPSRTFLKLTAAVFFGTVIFFIWQMRPSQSTAPDDESQDYMSRNWHVLCIIGVLFIYIFALGVIFTTGTRVMNEAISSLLLLGFIPIVDIGLRRWVSRLFHSEDEVDRLEVIQLESAGDDAAQEDTEATIDELSPAAPSEQANVETITAQVESRNYDAPIITNLRILLFIIAILIFAEIWDIGLFSFLQALVGERTTSILVNTSITGLLAYALWGIVNTAVTRLAGPETAAAGPGDEGGGGGGSRLGTVLPLFRKFLFITLLVMFILIVLSSLGVNIGPLIAGAGIVGIAIGFGAQTLVRDIVSGVFFLLDDAFRVGEYVTIGDTKGTVEKISVRSLRLRHHNGPLHTVPFGEIQTLTNWSRDWAIMKFEIRVPFETDVDMVRRIIKKVGAQMMEDEELGPLFLEPMKSQGVNRMDDSSFIIRCKFTAIPGNQFYIRREAYARIQAAFEEKGIKFAPRRVIVETATPEADPQKLAAAGAAAVAADDQDKQQEQVKDEPG